MNVSWPQRLSRLSKLLGTNIVVDDEERQGQVLDKYLLASQTKDDRQLEALRFNDDDLSLIGKLAVGQFGVVDVVRCRLDSRVYVRKTIEKRIALKTRGQCSPQYERDILVNALKSDALCVPHLLCAFQTESALKLVMHYADGGNLWDVIESSSDGKILENDLQWWAPQIVSAIEWCHSQGFVHRDIKPHNFVLTPTSHLLLIDFGSAAPLLPASPSGVQLVPKEHCLVPCGTCDYISPEILQFHEEALVALELEEDIEPTMNDGQREEVEGGYGRETDWWSFGAMMYEMAFGMAPFFANDVGHTYIKIIEHRTSLRFNTSASVSDAVVSLLEGVLHDNETRLGRHSVSEIKGHRFFRDVNWAKIHQRSRPPNLHLPQFTYSALASKNLNGTGLSQGDGELEEAETERFTQPFAFSVLFQSSRLSPGSVVRGTPSYRRPPQATNLALDAFVGFSWGPRLNAFNPLDAPVTLDSDATPRPALHREPVELTPRSALPLGITDPLPLPQYGPAMNTFRTPVRTNMLPAMRAHTVSIPRTDTGRRLQGRRPMSDREAMQQLVDCVGMSARKKVLESGKKPTHLRTISWRFGSNKEIQKFVPIPKPLVIETRRKGAMSTTSSESDSQPPSPTPRPGSSLSRRSGWGGRSTPSLVAGRSTPTLTFTATATGSGGTGNSGTTRNSAASDMFLEATRSTIRSTSYDHKLLAAEQRYSKLLDELSSLEESLGTVALHLQSPS